MIQLRILAERNIPHEFACVQVHRRERAPWWRRCRIAVRIAEGTIARRAVAGMRFTIDRGSVTGVSAVSTASAAATAAAAWRLPFKDGGIPSHAERVEKREVIDRIGHESAPL